MHVKLFGHRSQASSVVTLMALAVMTFGAACSSGPDTSQAPPKASQQTKPQTPTSSSSPATGSPTPGTASSTDALAWGPPEQVTAPRFADSDGPVAIIRVRGAATWAFWIAAGGRGRSQVEASNRGVDGHWSTPAVIGPTSKGYIYRLEAGLGPHGTAAVAWTSPNGNGNHSTVKVAYRTGGRWRAPHDVGQGEVGGVVIDNSGHVTVVWAARPSSADVGNLINVSRLADGHWQPPEVLTKRGWEPDVATNSRGDLASVWATDHGVGVSMRRSDTATWDAPTAIPGLQYPDDPRIVIDGRGRALALWARSTEEESYARRHLAWANTRADHTWSQAEFLDERQHRAVIGDQITLAMNARGKAVAAWSPTSLDEGGFRVSEFSFATGWANPRRLGDFAYLPSALVTESGSTVVTLNFSDPPDWVYRHPGADWVVGGQINNGEPMGAFGDGQRMATLYRTGRHLTARMLLVRGNR